MVDEEMTDPHKSSMEEEVGNILLLFLGILRFFTISNFFKFLLPCVVVVVVVVD